MNIKQFVAGTMLLVFAISITPKKYFHDLFTEHEDELFTLQTSHEKQLTAYQYNCGFVNAVAITPFIATALKVQQNPLLSARGFNCNGPSFVEGRPLLQSQLRGPPQA